MKKVIVISSELRTCEGKNICDQVNGRVDFRLWDNMQRPISDQALDQAWFQAWFQAWEKMDENSQRYTM